MKVSRMCDRCFRQVGDNEDIEGFRISDGEQVKQIIGHKECVAEIKEILVQLYHGDDESEDSDEV